MKAELVEQATLSWDDIVAEHSARVYRLAYRLTGNRQDAEDLTQ
ncbi:MAG: sigma factor, partial [Aeromicrobium sp.]